MWHPITAFDSAAGIASGWFCYFWIVRMLACGTLVSLCRQGDSPRRVKLEVPPNWKASVGQVLVANR